MNAFNLEIGTTITYQGLYDHSPGKVIGIDFYTKLRDSKVIKNWTSYSITSSPELSIETQLQKGDRWRITWDGKNLREWIYTIEDNINLSGKKVESITGDIAINFEGDSDVSSSEGYLQVHEAKENGDLWFSKEIFYPASGGEEIICFLSQPILNIDDLKITQY